MRERLIELLIDGLDESEILPHMYGEPMGVDFSKLADYIIENGVVVLPCRVGDIVYTTYGGALSKYEVKELVINDFCWAELFNKEYVLEHKLIKSCISFDIGKTVFLTREEAEKALERSKQ